MKRLKQIIENAEQHGFITEADILLLKNRKNHDHNTVSEVNDFLNKYVSGEGLSVSDAQSDKGFLWLWDKYKTPKGKERLNNPFGYREIDILESAKEVGKRFTFDGYYNCGDRYRDWFIPIYSLYSDKGCFQYYCHGGNIVIIE